MINTFNLRERKQRLHMFVRAKFLDQRKMFLKLSELTRVLSYWPTDIRDPDFP
jgi:hypothetical protein